MHLLRNVAVTHLRESSYATLMQLLHLGDDPSALALAAWLTAIDHGSRTTGTRAGLRAATTTPDAVGRGFLSVCPVLLDASRHIDAGLTALRPPGDLREGIAAVRAALEREEPSPARAELMKPPHRTKSPTLSYLRVIYLQDDAGEKLVAGWRKGHKAHIDLWSALRARLLRGFWYELNLAITPSAQAVALVPYVHAVAAMRERWDSFPPSEINTWLPKDNDRETDERQADWHHFTEKHKLTTLRWTDDVARNLFGRVPRGIAARAASTDATQRGSVTGRDAADSRPATRWAGPAGSPRDVPSLKATTRRFYTPAPPTAPVQGAGRPGRIDTPPSPSTPPSGMRTRPPRPAPPTTGARGTRHVTVPALPHLDGFVVGPAVPAPRHERPSNGGARGQVSPLEAPIRGLPSAHNLRACPADVLPVLLASTLRCDDFTAAPLFAQALFVVLVAAPSLLAAPARLAEMTVAVETPTASLVFDKAQGALWCRPTARFAARLARPRAMTRDPYAPYWPLPLPAGLLGLLRAHLAQAGEMREGSERILWAAPLPGRYLAAQDVQDYLEYWQAATVCPTLFADDLMRFGEALSWSSDARVAPAMIAQFTGEYCPALRVACIYNAPTVAERRDALALHYSAVVAEMARRLLAWTPRPPFTERPATYARRLRAWAGVA